jgi:hypothetical protein
MCIGRSERAGHAFREPERRRTAALNCAAAIHVT